MDKYVLVVLGLMQELAKQFRNIMAADSTAAVLREMDNEDSNPTQLPSQLQPNQTCHLQFRPTDEPLICTVRCVHFTVSKVKYDLGLWLGDGTVDYPEFETRIYNVDSNFVKPI